MILDLGSAPRARARSGVRVKLAGAALFAYAFAHGPAANAAPPRPAPAPPLVTIELEPHAATKWTVRVRNATTGPLRLPIDARLVSFEVLAPAAVATTANAAKTRAAAKSVKCELPGDMKPDADEVGTLSVEAGKAVAVDIDPRLVCFGVKEATALAGAARAIAKYTLPGVVNKARSVASEPVDIPEDARPPVRPGPEAEEEEDEESLVISMPARVDGARAATTALRVSVKNNGAATRTTFLRPGNVGFLVEGPSGAFTCPVKGTPPIRELQSTLRPRGSGSVDVLLGPTCPGRAFDRPGIYVVRPVFSPRQPPWDQGQSVHGEHRGAPALVRLRTAARPLLLAPPRPE